MLFNSFEFIFLFAPVVLGGFWLFRSRPAVWLIAASVFFYACWQPLNLLLIAPSIGVNYLVVRSLLRWADTRPRASRLLFWAGIAFNVCVLGYFKYTNFLVGVFNDVSGGALTFSSVALPLGISFITFQKIALLVDVRQGRVREVRWRDYLLFVLFFPPLIAGPIVHYRELMPQFAGLRPQSDDIAVGATLFFVGLCKKVLLADTIAPLIAPAWAQAAVGAHPGLITAWGAALGYILQLYFDFSGYSEMATGAARLFGIKLPVNFDSPLKATSIIDFWQRWHVTLTRFLTAYLYNPIALARTRRLAADRGVVVRGDGLLRPATFLSLVALPTMSTMFISGLWHGAGYQFIVFGALHGLALVVNHWFRTIRRAWWPPNLRFGPAGALSSWAITFLFVVAAQVFFRAPSLRAALDMLAGMAGMHGASLPMAILAKAGPILAAFGLHPTGVWQSGYDFLVLWGVIAAALLIVLACPNILEILAAHQPALGFKARPARSLLPRPQWAASPGWALGLSVVTTAGVLSLGRVSAFLYWQF